MLEKPTLTKRRMQMNLRMMKNEQNEEKFGKGTECKTTDLETDWMVHGYLEK